MVESSKVLRTPRTEKQTKIELFDALRQELESSVLEKASKAVQELILDQNGIGSDITETVEKVYCRLSGWDPPLFPTFNPNQRQRKREREREEIKGKEKENLDTALKKKKFNETNTEEGGDKGAS